MEDGETHRLPAQAVRQLRQPRGRGGLVAVRGAFHRPRGQRAGGPVQRQPRLYARRRGHGRQAHARLRGALLQQLPFRRQRPCLRQGLAHLGAPEPAPGDAAQLSGRERQLLRLDGRRRHRTLLRPHRCAALQGRGGHGAETDPLGRRGDHQGQGRHGHALPEPGHGRRQDLHCLRDRRLRQRNDVYLRGRPTRPRGQGH